MAYSTGTLTGTYQTWDGTPASGTIEIIPNSPALIDAEGDVILSGRVKVTLDETGSFSEPLPATDDATVEPATGRQYTVVAKLRHQHLKAVTGIELAGGETVDMADVTSAVETQAMPSVWLTEEEYAAVVARVAALEAAPAISPETQAALDATLPTGSAAAQRVLSRIKRNTEDVIVLDLSDSTGLYTALEPRWYRKLAEKVMLDWPTHTFKFVQWDDTAQNWGAADTLQTGTGPYTVWFYNAAVTGTTLTYFLGSRFTFVTDLQPDLVFVNYGLNDGSADLVGAKAHGRERMLMLTESVTAYCPSASVIILSQNERIDVTNEVVATRANRYARAAEQRGYGFIDTRQAFAEDSRGLAALLNVDGLHPNNAGSDLQRDTVYRHMIYRPHVQPRPMLPPCFLTTGPNLLANGDFATFTTPPTLTSWTATNATLTKDTTHFEGPNGYSVNIDAVAAASSQIDQSFNLQTVKGRWVTVAARVYVPTGQNNTAARVSLQCGDGADVTSIPNNVGRDGWQWIVVSKRISPTATFARVRVYGDSASTAAANISVDRVVAVLGQLPRDVR